MSNWNGYLKMEKQELRVGMIIEVRKGIRYLLLEMDGKILPSRIGSYIDFKYNNDLTFKGNVDFDIMKVYQPKRPFTILEDIATHQEILVHDCDLIYDRLENQGIKVGDKVKVISNGESFINYTELFEKYCPELSKYFVYGVSPEEGCEYKVVGIGQHCWKHYGEVIIIQNTQKQVYLILEKGLEKVI